MTMQKQIGMHEEVTVGMEVADCSLDRRKTQTGTPEEDDVLRNTAGVAEEGQPFDLAQVRTYSSCHFSLLRMNMQKHSP